MAVLAADGARLGAHRHGLQAHAGEGLEIGHEHLVVGMLAGFPRQVEGIGILHQELAAAHHAEARAHLVAELPLDVIEVARQVLVGLHPLPEDVGDHLLVGGSEQHVAVMPVLDAQHLLAIGVVAAGLAPEVRGLDRRHQHFDRPCPVLLLAHDLLDLAQHAVADRQPGIAARRLLPNHAAAQHELVGDDLRFLGIVAQNGHEILGKAHGNPAWPTGSRPFYGKRPGTQDSADDPGCLVALLTALQPSICSRATRAELWRCCGIFNSTSRKVVLAFLPIRTRPRCPLR
jgi:hypothetical protein